MSYPRSGRLLPRWLQDNVKNFVAGLRFLRSFLAWRSRKTFPTTFKEKTANDKQ